MSNETMVTIQGWVASDPQLRYAGGVPVLNFRVGSTPRHFRRSTNEWVDGETQWYAVSAWRNLAINGKQSIERSQPVIIHGRLQHRSYTTKDGGQGVSLEIEAVTVGHDLSRGTTWFRKEIKVPQPGPSGVEGNDATGQPKDDPWLTLPSTAAPAASVEGSAEAPVGANAA